MDIMCLKDLEPGRMIEGDSGQAPNIPDDFDMDKFHRGRRFYRDNLFGCTLAMFFSLILGLNIAEFLEVLVFTRQSDTTGKAVKRYISTFRHVAMWHYGDVWDKTSEAHKSITTVRSIHGKVRKDVAAALSKDTGLFLSQYDMGIVLSGFMSCIIRYPKQLGIVSSEQDLDDYVYFWYGIGHLLGIQRDFNICAHGLANADALCKEIEMEIVQKIDSPPTHFEQMSSAIINGFTRGRRFPLLTVSGILYFSLMHASQRYDVEAQCLTNVCIPDIIRFYLLKFLFLILRNVKVFRNHLRHAVEREFRLAFISHDHAEDDKKSI